VAYALSADDVVGNADDIPLGTGTLFHASPYDRPTGDEPYAIATSRDPLYAQSIAIPPGVAPGTYRLVAVLDPADDAVEYDETNNAMLGPAVKVTRPPMSLAVSVPARPVTIGRPATARVAFASTTGRPAARRYNVALYLSDDPVPSPDDLALPSQTVTASASAKRPWTLNVPFTLPLGSARPGTRYLIAVAAEPPISPPPRWSPGSTDATLTAAARVSVVGPRLSVAVRAVRPRAWAAEVTLRVTNGGNAPFAGATTLRVMLASAPDPTAALLSVRRTFSIRAGKSGDVTVAVPLAPADPSALVAIVG
jgi:hypothetical protein